MEINLKWQLRVQNVYIYYLTASHLLPRARQYLNRHAQLTNEKGGGFQKGIHLTLTRLQSQEAAEPPVPAGQAACAKLPCETGLLSDTQARPEPEEEGHVPAVQGRGKALELR